jgi:hypothetical protein
LQYARQSLSERDDAAAHDATAASGREFGVGARSRLALASRLPGVCDNDELLDPDSSRNAVNLKTRKPKPLEVAVLGDADLDVADIVAGSALLGDPDGSPVSPTAFDYRDVDGDGDTDLVYEFDVNEMKAAGAVSASTTTLYLEAGLTNGGIIFGSDAINRKGKG